MLLVADAERLLIYNESARFIWEALSEGLSQDEIVVTIADDHGIDPGRVRAEVSSMIAEWEGNDLLGGPTHPLQAPVASPLAPEDPVWAAHWVCRIRDKRIRLAIEDPAHARSLQLLFGHLAVEAPADMSLEVRSAGEGRSAIIQDGRERARISGMTGLRDTIGAAMVEF